MNTTTRLPRALSWAVIGVAAGAADTYGFGHTRSFLLIGGGLPALGAVFGFFKRPAEVETPAQEDANCVAREKNRDSQRRVFGSAVCDAVTPHRFSHCLFDEVL